MEGDFMIIYVYKKDNQSIGYTKDCWGGDNYEVEVEEGFVAGAVVCDPKSKKWSPLPAYEVTHNDHVNQAELERKFLIENANNVMEDWIISLKLDEISDDDKDRLVKWRKYVNDVKSVSLDSAPDITWPPLPQ